VRRWIILFGRSGTVLLAVGLALLLASLIPTIQMSISMGSDILSQRTWSSQRTYEGILTPQHSLRFSVTANATLNVYVFEVNTQTIYSWINEHHPDLIYLPLNVTYLEEFLEANLNSIGWNTTIDNGNIEHEYIPTKTTNATLAFSNPSLDSTSVEWEVYMIGQVAPVTKVRTLAEGAIPIGFMLALPWLIDSLRAKIRRRSSKL